MFKLNQHRIASFEFNTNLTVDFYLNKVKTYLPS